MLKLPGFTMAVLCGMSTYAAYAWLESTLAPNLQNEYSFSIEQVGKFFCIFPIFYVISSLVVSRVPKSVNLHS